MSQLSSNLSPSKYIQSSSLTDITSPLTQDTNSTMSHSSEGMAKRSTKNANLAVMFHHVKHRRGLPKNDLDETEKESADVVVIRDSATELILDDVAESMVIAETDPTNQVKQTDAVKITFQFEKQFVKLSPRVGNRISSVIFANKYFLIATLTEEGIKFLHSKEFNEIDGKIILNDLLNTFPLHLYSFFHFIYQYREKKISGIA